MKDRLNTHKKKKEKSEAERIYFVWKTAMYLGSCYTSYKYIIILRNYHSNFGLIINCHDENSFLESSENKGKKKN